MIALSTSSLRLPHSGSVGRSARILEQRAIVDRSVITLRVFSEDADDERPGSARGCERAARGDANVYDARPVL